MRLKCPAALPNGTKQYALLPPPMQQKKETELKSVSLSASTSLLSTSSREGAVIPVEMASGSVEHLGSCIWNRKGCG